MRVPFGRVDGGVWGGAGTVLPAWAARYVDGPGRTFDREDTRFAVGTDVGLLVWTGGGLGRRSSPSLGGLGRAWAWTLTYARSLKHEVLWA